MDTHHRPGWPVHAQLMARFLFAWIVKPKPYVLSYQLDINGVFGALNPQSISCLRVFYVQVSHETKSICRLHKENDHYNIRKVL